MTDLTSIFHALGPHGVVLTYLAEESDGLYHCELALPRDRYTVTIVTDCGPDPDIALAVTVEKAERYRLQDGEAVAA